MPTVLICPSNKLEMKNKNEVTGGVDKGMERQGSVFRIWIPTIYNLTSPYASSFGRCSP